MTRWATKTLRGLTYKSSPVELTTNFGKKIELKEFFREKIGCENCQEKLTKNLHITTLLI